MSQYSLKGKRILITGGVGSIGSALAQALIKYCPHSIAVFDNNEYGTFRLRSMLRDNNMRYFLGDITDYRRLKLAMNKTDLVFHLCALKHIDLAEYNPIEVIKTNVLGTINLIECAFETKPEKVIFVSSDKAVNFSSLYGSTKFQGEKLVLWANSVQEDTVFSVVRLCNVKESRGNVFEIWKNQLDKGEPLTVTDKKMSRYFISMDEAIGLIIKAISMASGGDIFVPRNPLALNIFETASKLSKVVKLVGVRPGEKMTEILLTDEEKGRSNLTNDFYIIGTERLIEEISQ